MKGESVFSNEEKEQVFSFKGFFQDGVQRDIVILSKEIVNAVGKFSNKPYTRVDWTVADAATGETKDIKYDFEFTGAMKAHKDVMKYETSVFRVTPKKTGENNGWDTFSYSVEYLGEEGSVQASAPVQAF